MICMNIESAVCFVCIHMYDFTKLNANYIRTPLLKITFMLNSYALYQ